MQLALTFLITFIIAILSEHAIQPAFSETPLPPVSLAKEQLFLDADALEPGMKGYGKTVFSGKNIEEFDIEIIGVMKNWEAKSDMILIKMSGASLDKTGIIAGMSGSPVYVDDKMIGAVSYGWTFSKDAIAGLTPIKDMLKVLHNIDDDTVTKGQIVANQGPRLKPQDADLPLPVAKTDLVPIKTPIMVSGFDSRVLERMASELEKYGLFPVQSGAGCSAGNWTGSASGNSFNDLQPGAAVAAVLVRGDLNASSVGTLTYREGDNVVAFGHPFFHTGTTNLPMSLAHVYTVIANQSTSFKVAAATDVVGRISQDRKPGIAGTIGKYAQMIPCEVEINGVQNARYNFEIVHDKMLSTNLIQWAAESVLLNAVKQSGPKMVKLHLTIQLEGRHEPVEIENTYYVMSARWDPVYDITAPIANLLNNPFNESVTIKKISLGAHIFDSRRTAKIENISVSKRAIKPGETIQINVSLRPYCGQIIHKTVNFQIPMTVVPGHVISLTACDSLHSHSIDKVRSPEMFKPKNFDQIVALIEATEKRTNLIVRLQLPKSGINYRGHSYPSLPSSLLSIMAFSNQSGVGILYDEIVQKIETDWVLRGKQSISLVVEEG